MERAVLLEASKCYEASSGERFDLAFPLANEDMSFTNAAATSRARFKLTELFFQRSKCYR
jgi:hypothetical protein